MNLATQEQKSEAKEISKETMAENFQKVINYIYETPRGTTNPKQNKQKGTPPRHIILKGLNTEEKRKTSKIREERKRGISFKRARIILTSDFSAEQ